MGGFTPKFNEFNRYLKEKACQKHMGPGYYNDHD